MSKMKYLLGIKINVFVCCNFYSSKINLLNCNMQSKRIYMQISDK